MLDLTRDYGTVLGQSHARFHQNGKHYNAQKDEIDLDTGKVVKKYKPPVLKDPITDLESGKSVESESETSASVNEDSVTDLESIHYSKLKKMVEQAGGEYVDKAQAIAYLRSI